MVKAWFKRQSKSTPSFIHYRLLLFTLLLITLLHRCVDSQHYYYVLTDEQLTHQPLYAYYDPNNFITMQAFETQQESSTTSTQTATTPTPQRPTAAASSAASNTRPVELEFGYVRADLSRNESAAGTIITSSEGNDQSNSVVDSQQRNNQNQTLPFSPTTNNTTGNNQRNQTAAILPPTPIGTGNGRSVNRTAQVGMTATGAKRGGGVFNTSYATGTGTMTGRYWTATGTGGLNGVTGDVTGIVPAGRGTAVPSSGKRGMNVETAHVCAAVVALAMLSLF